MFARIRRPFCIPIKAGGITPISQRMHSQKLCSSDCDRHSSLSDVTIINVYDKYINKLQNFLGFYQLTVMIWLKHENWPNNSVWLVIGFNIEALNQRKELACWWPLVLWVLGRCCQTNENSHRIACAALIYALNSWRHSVRAAVRLILKLSRE